MGKRFRKLFIYAAAIIFLVASAGLIIADQSKVVLVGGGQAYKPLDDFMLDSEVLGKGDKWYVDDAVSASGDGKSWDYAFKTIGEAIDAADDWDTVRVAIGKYYDEGAALNIDQRGLKLLGANKSGDIWGFTSIIARTADHRVITVNAEDVEIAGFAFVQDNAKATIAIATTVSTYKTYIHHCYFGGTNVTYGVAGGLVPATTYDSVDVAVENCTFYQVATGVDLNGTRCTIRNNVFMLAASDVAINVTQTGGNRPDLRIIDNVIRGADSGDSGITFTGTPTEALLIVSGNKVYNVATPIAAVKYTSWYDGNYWGENDHLYHSSGNQDGRDFYVDSNAGTTGLDARSWKSAVLTIDEAIDLGTANNGDVIHVAQSHAGDIDGAAAISADKAGMKIVGYGVDRNRATLTWSATGSTIDIGAANITIENFVLDMTGVDTVDDGIDVDAAGFTLRNCEIILDDGSFEVDNAIVCDAAADRMLITHCKFSGTGKSGGVSVIEFDATAPDNIEIAYCEFNTDSSTGIIIGSSTVNIYIHHSTFNNASDDDYIVYLSGNATGKMEYCHLSTNAIGTALDIGYMDIHEVYWSDNDTGTADAASVKVMINHAGMVQWSATELDAIELQANDALVDEVLDRFMALADGTGAAPASVVEDSILAKILGDDATAVATTFDNTRDSLEALGRKTDYIQSAAQSTEGNGSIVYYVDSVGGSDAYDGLSWTQAKITIQAAVDLCTNHNTIYIRGGATFTEDITLSNDNYGMKLIGVSDSPFLPMLQSTGTTATTLTVEASCVEIRNIHFYGSVRTVAFVKFDTVSTADGKGVLVDSCNFEGAGSHSAILFNGAGYNNVLSNNTFWGFWGANTGYQATVYELNADLAFINIRIEGNTFMENDDHLILSLGSSVIKDNIFQASGQRPEAALTVILNTDGAPTPGNTGGNMVVGNYFGDTITNRNHTNGYYGTASDMWTGNYFADGIDSSGSPPTS